MLLNNLVQQCFKGKVIMLLGARQVGKTTLLRTLTQTIGKQFRWFNADEADIYRAFSDADTSTQLMGLIGNETELVIIDEAQQINEIGKKIKLIYDNYPHIQVIATGSSALDLMDKTAEPLTGRKREFQLFPVSFQELTDTLGTLEAKRLLHTRLVFGSYPEIINNPGNEKEALLEISKSYLYKDLLMIDGIRKTAVLEKLLQALAFQVGQEVNFNELARLIGNIDTATVEKYIDLLEKAFIVFKLPALSRNLRNELKKGKKYYFYDNGIRNVLISNYNPVDLRADVGALWENYLISERKKRNAYTDHTPNAFFWRTRDQAEIDYIEETGGMLNAYEIKWKNQKVSFPKSFLQAYPEHTTQVITSENYGEFVG
ncbi:MAG: ATP-binding protein [Spirosomataceae bacterium]